MFTTVSSVGTQTCPRFVMLSDTIGVILISRASRGTHRCLDHAFILALYGLKMAVLPKPIMYEILHSVGMYIRKPAYNESGSQKKTTQTRSHVSKELLKTIFLIHTSLSLQIPTKTPSCHVILFPPLRSPISPSHKINMQKYTPLIFLVRLLAVSHYRPHLLCIYS